MRDFELEHLRTRVMALESLEAMLLVRASDGQLKRGREMTVHISPRPGHMPHPLTVRAAAKMNDTIERAEAFEDVTP